MHQRTIIVLIALSVSLLGFATASQAEMSSSSFRITSSVLSGGGGDMESASFHLHSTLGQSTPLGNASSTGFSLNSGYWYTLLLTLMGDVNGDGEVNLADVITALQVITGQSSEQVMKGADVNVDDVIGLAEAIMVLQTLLK